jgi:IS30 family transposase
MTPVMIALVESKLRNKLSPEQVSGWLLEEKEELLSHETIYLHIRADKAVGRDLYTELCTEVNDGKIVLYTTHWCQHYKNQVY